jgi:DNA-binding transcriptional MerR regulator
VRHFPHLQIVDNATFEGAQAILQANEEKIGQRRRPNGQLPGFAVENVAPHPRHLLSGLVRCAACGSRLQVGGADGKYLFCRNYLKGSCTCKTQLLRDRAERLIVQAIGERVLANPAWRQAVLDELDAAHRREQAQLPTDLQETERTLAAVEAKISRLVDQVENGTAAPEVAERLAQRRAAKKALQEQLNRARRAVEAVTPPPTGAWVEEQFQHLHTLLLGGGPAAALALRELVGGRIVVEEVQQPGRQRCFLRGSFTIRTAALAASLRGQGAGGGAPAGTEAGEEVVLDFREPRSFEGIADRVKALFDQGVSYDDIAAELGCQRNVVTKALRHWHAQRGLPPPDGRSLRKRLARPSLVRGLADKAKQLWDQNLLLQEIADQLQCCQQTATQAIAHWFRSRGLEVPDGRTRRKQLPGRSSPKDEPGEPTDDQVDFEGA